MTTTSSSSSEVDRILSAAGPHDNSFECFGLATKLYEPSEIRRSFYKLSLKVHPDKCAHPRSKEAFQKLADAFEVLYELESQKEHLEQIVQEKQQKTSIQTSGAAASSHKNKKQKTKHDWKEERKKKKQRREQDNQKWTKSWDDVLKELRRREELEKAFRQRHSDARLEKRVQGMIWRAMRICRSLDERAGCPPSFVNGVWAPLYEQEVIRTHKGLPEGWEWRWEHSLVEQQQLQQPSRRIYRNVITGDESFEHPVPDVERLLHKARNALETNNFRFHSEPRLFLGEIIDYLHEDHDYMDMDDEMMELEEEEQARLAALGNGSNSQKEYDY